jgi:DNA polymerase elongation subunit (family B)
MDLLRLNNNVKWNNKQDLILQIVDIKGFDEKIEFDEEEEKSDESQEIKKNDEENELSNDDEENNKLKSNVNNDVFTIIIFGINQNGDSVSIKVNGFHPYFFVYIENINKKKDCNNFVESLRKNIPAKYQDDCIIDYGLIKRKKFVGFSPELDEYGKFVENKNYDFIYIKFRSKKIMQICSNILSPRDDNGNILKHKYKILNKLKEKNIIIQSIPELYESNIDPLLRFLHIRDLNSCGWIKCPHNKYEVNTSDFIDKKNSYCLIDISIAWDKIESYDKSNIEKLLVASFDIEADSSHGDFPIAKKGYKKLAADMFDNINKLKKKNKTNKKNEIDIKGLLKKIINISIYENKEELEKLNKEFNYNFDINTIYLKNKDLLTNNKVTKVINLILNLFELEKNCSQVVFKSKEFKQSRKLKISYYNSENKKFPQKELQIYYIISNSNIASNNEYILKENDIIIKKGLNSKVLFNKEDIKNNITGKLELRMRIFDKNKFTKQWEFINLDTIQKMNEFLLELETKNIFSNKELNEFKNIDNCLEEFKLKRDLILENITDTMNKYLPEIEGDKVIQIGTVIKKYSETETYLKHIVTLNGCDKIEGSIIESYDNERDVIINWARFINKLDPDIIIGYNIFGFDYKFLWERACELNCERIIGSLLTRLKSKEHHSYLETQKLSSAGLGDNELYFINMPGRVQIDLYKIAQRDYKLDSYKLDCVSSTFINGVIKNYKNLDENSTDLMLKTCLLYTDNIVGLVINNYISIVIKTLNGLDKFKNGQKFKIINIDIENKTLTIETNDNLELDVFNKKYLWGLSKDDVGPKDIFKFQKGSNKDRAIIAKYCLMDCELVLNLSDKLDIITNNIGMANVCSVPLSFIFLRGQGIKIFSLVSKQCRNEKTLIPVLQKDFENDEKDGYEGAIVLKAKPKIYLENPIAVLDYSSLYPSCMISENLSHDTQIDNPLYLGEIGKEKLLSMGLNCVDISYDNYSYILKGKTYIKIINKINPTINCRYVLPLENEDGSIYDNNRGIIPRILIKLLTARKTTRKKIVLEPDPFKKAILDGLQLAYKVTANSLYGSLGAKTSPVFKKDIAASTTATGRKLLYFAKNFVEKEYPGSDTIYGDTDSVFISFKNYIIKKHGYNLTSQELLQKTIDYGIEAGDKAKKLLKKPHDLEYEKTFFPFILLSKKRYVGNKYETDINSYKQTSMGIVLKRRDNAQIVKYIYGGIIDRIINKSNILESIEFLKTSLNDLLNGKIPIEQLIITKTLKGYYKEPDRISHKVLADRIAARDPGNKPQSNDRIPFVYIETPKEIKLQGNKIETPKFISDNKIKIKIDYYFYITNQIMKPVSQIYSLILEDLKEYKKDKNYYQNLRIKLNKENKDKKKINDKIQSLRMDEIKTILFGDIIRKCENKKNKSQEITKFFKPAQVIQINNLKKEQEQEQEEELFDTDEEIEINDDDFEDIEIEI